jgi:hypothetical protein
MTDSKKRDHMRPLTAPDRSERGTGRCAGTTEPVGPRSSFGGGFACWSLMRPPVLLLLLAVAIVSAGCQVGPRAQQFVGLPAQHSVQSDQLLILSDFKLEKDHPLFQDLVQMRLQVAEILKLPLAGQQVVIYLFSDEPSYRQYIETTFPGLPARRAYFVGTSRELAVYTFWGERIQEDLRHEFTHGLLHASLKDVPLWLDEGLAEYFEVVAPTPGRVNLEYAGVLSNAIANGWRPDLQRLERLQDLAQMQRADYQEAWGWVHYLLNSTPDNRQVLLDYLQELRHTAQPGPLSTRLSAVQPQFAQHFLSYVASLNTPGMPPPRHWSQATTSDPPEAAFEMPRVAPVH